MAKANEFGPRWTHDEATDSIAQEISHRTGVNMVACKPAARNAWRTATPEDRRIILGGWSIEWEAALNRVADLAFA